jgi:hypothetical protein
MGGTEVSSARHPNRQGLYFRKKGREGGKCSMRIQAFFGGDRKEAQFGAL